MKSKRTQVSKKAQRHRAKAVALQLANPDAIQAVENRAKSNMSSLLVLPDEILLDILRFVYEDTVVDCCRGGIIPCIEFFPEDQLINDRGELGDDNESDDGSECCMYEMVPCRDTIRDHPDYKPVEVPGAAFKRVCKRFNSLAKSSPSASCVTLSFCSQKCCMWRVQKFLGKTSMQQIDTIQFPLWHTLPYWSWTQSMREAVEADWEYEIGDISEDFPGSVSVSIDEDAFKSKKKKSLTKLLLLHGEQVTQEKQLCVIRLKPEMSSSTASANWNRFQKARHDKRRCISVAQMVWIDESIGR